MSNIEELSCYDCYQDNLDQYNLVLKINELVRLINAQQAAIMSQQKLIDSMYERLNNA